MNKTLTLTDFLLARIAEDEARAKSSYRVLDVRARIIQRPDEIVVDDEVMSHAEYLQRFCEPAPDTRALVRCEGDRRIVAECLRAIDMSGDPSEDGSEYLAEQVLRTLARPYADHPDYREEWRA